MSTNAGEECYDGNCLVISDEHYSKVDTRQNDQRGDITGALDKGNTSRSTFPTGYGQSLAYNYQQPSHPSSLPVRGNAYMYNIPYQMPDPVWPPMPSNYGYSASWPPSRMPPPSAPSGSFVPLAMLPGDFAGPSGSSQGYSSLQQRDIPHRSELLRESEAELWTHLVDQCARYVQDESSLEQELSKTPSYTRARPGQDTASKDTSTSAEIAGDFSVEQNIKEMREQLDVIKSSIQDSMYQLGYSPARQRGPWQRVSFSLCGVAQGRRTNESIDSSYEILNDQDIAKARERVSKCGFTRSTGVNRRENAVASSSSQGAHRS